MKRWYFVSAITFVLIAVLLSAVIALSRGKGVQTPMRATAQESDASSKMNVQVTPWGPTQVMLDEASATLSERAQVRRYLKGTRSRLVSFELLMDDDKDAEPVPPNRYRSTFYDYTNNQTIVAESSFDHPDVVNITTSASQPLPSREEFDEAVSILKADPKLGSAINDERLQVYPPMPPLFFGAKSKSGRVERAVNVGLLAKDQEDKSLERANEVVSVNLSRRTVVRFAEGAPPTSKAVPTPNASCGPGAGGSSTGRGVAGQFQFTINDGNGAQLWSFLAIRPSASTGADASGIELQQVKYKGKLLLKRAHVPILNVSYDNNTCGPFRDWEYAESQFNADPANGTDVAPGVRSCTVPPTTQLDSSVDTGNHQGIAFYKSGDETILVSEMSAGWYRYISEWRFNADGTLKPRFGMGATVNSCTCNGHIHHAYWRFDFDIDSSSPNRVTQSNGGIRPNLVTPSITTETKRFRGGKIYWVVRNPLTGDSYKILPNSNDGTAAGDTYGSGDIWFLRYGKNEIDDSLVRTGTAANLDAFVNGQPVEDTDLVVWYGIHIPHNRPGGHTMGHPFAISGEFVAGPDLVPNSW